MNNIYTARKALPNTKYANNLNKKPLDKTPVYPNTPPQYYTPTKQNPPGVYTPTVPSNKNFTTGTGTGVNKQNTGGGSAGGPQKMTEADRLTLANIMSYGNSAGSVEKQQEVARKRAENTRRLQEINRQQQEKKTNGVVNTLDKTAKIIGRGLDKTGINPIETADNIGKGYRNNIKGAANIFVDTYNAATGDNLKKLDTGENKSFVERTFDNYKAGEDYRKEINKAYKSGEQGIAKTALHQLGGAVDTTLNITDDAFSSAIGTIATQKQKDTAASGVSKLLETEGGKKVQGLASQYKSDMDFLKKHDPVAYRDYKTLFTGLRAGFEGVGAASIGKTGASVKGGVKNLGEEAIEKAITGKKGKLTDVIGENSSATTKNIAGNSEYDNFMKDWSRKLYSEGKFVENPNYLIDYDESGKIIPESIPKTYFTKGGRTHFMPAGELRNISGIELDVKNTLKDFADKKISKGEVGEIPASALGSDKNAKIILNKNEYKKINSKYHDAHGNYKENNFIITLNDPDDILVDPVTKAVTHIKETPHGTQYICPLELDPKTGNYNIKSFYESFAKEADRNKGMESMGSKKNLEGQATLDEYKNRFGKNDLKNESSGIGGNPDEVSKVLKNSLVNENEGVKKNRLDGEKYSFQKANTGLTNKGSKSKKRIVVGLDDNNELILLDGRHLLEAYTKLGKNIPNEIFDFASEEAKKLLKEKLK